jgi:putative transposase
VRKSFKYKAKLAPSVVRNAEAQLALCAELYNAALTERREAWRMCRKRITRFDQFLQLPEIRRDRPEIAAVPNVVLRDAVTRVDLAFARFFKRGGHPRFKARSRYDSLTGILGRGVKVDGRRVTFRGIGTVRLFLSRPIEGRIKTVTLRRDRCGDWWVTFSCDCVSAMPLAATGGSIGVDVGLAQFATLSDGTAIANPRHLRVAEVMLKRTQRRANKRKRGSVRRRNMDRVLARKHRKVERTRRDFHFKTALRLVRNYDLIAVEDLNVHGLCQMRLAKSVHDAGWSQFIAILNAKAESAGRIVVAVNPRGTSQVCSGCGCQGELKTLAIRTHECAECGLVLDRDHNAALNILHLARAELAASCPASKAAA